MTATIHAMPRAPGKRRGRRRLWIPLAAVLLLLLIVTPSSVNALVTYWWFNELGYGGVYTTELAATWAVGLLGAVVSFAILKGLAYVVTRVARAQGRAQSYTGIVPVVVNIVLVVLSLLPGFGLAGNWQHVLFALHQQPFGVQDPIFHHDVAFYVFTLPLLQDLLGWLGTVLFIGLVVALILLYVLDIGGRLASGFDPNVLVGDVMGGVQFDLRWLRPYLTVISAWLALLALLIAGSNWLMRYNSLISPGNGFQGGDYVDLNAGIPRWTILSVLGILAALALLVNALAIRRWTIVGAVIALWLVAWALLVIIYPALVQTLKVNPAPLAAETPQIAHNLAATRAAFNLANTTASDFPATAISASQLASNRATLESLRVVDPDQFSAAAQQQQAIRTYYDFTNVGLDRYQVAGHLRQVLIAAREMNQDQLPTTAQTWQNLNFTYTHGYGLVMAPVNQVASDGSPLYWIKDIPPHANPDTPIAASLPPVRQPRFYFGLDTNNPVFVDTGAKEFDFGTDYSEYSGTYKGTAGIPIGGFLHRLAWVIYFNSPIQIGTSSYLTSSSRVLLHRNIDDRLGMLAPFLTYDGDPYLVLDSSGHPYWIVDAYTSSTNYPYAEPYTGDLVPSLSGVTYLRNAVKATIDPYNGTVRLYVADPSDPIAGTIARTFPGLLRPISSMPSDLRSHVRYPEDLFNVQSEVFARYHQTDPQSWYNNEDQWAIPALPSESDSSQLVPIAPYYAVTRLPGSSRDEFVLMRPYSPLNKNNMVSLLVGRSDSPHYGQLISYRFPLGRQVLGPVQFQANVQQQPDFSRDITLLSQQGSRVHFGTIIITSVGSWLLYLEPLYLQAENSKIPQLQRVIVYANGKLVWGTSIDNALGQIFGNAAPPPTSSTPPSTTPPPPATGGITGTVPLTGTARAILVQIQAHLKAAQAAYGRGDFATYAREQAAAYRLIKQALGQ